MEEIIIMNVEIRL